MRTIPVLLCALLVATACASDDPAPRRSNPARSDTASPDVASEDLASEGRLTALPEADVRARDIEPGFHDLGIVETRDSRIFIPDGYRPGTPAPMLLALHGANGGPQGSLNPFIAMAREHDIVLVGPGSRQNSWDLIYGGFGPDVRIIDKTLKHVFARYSIDPKRVGVAGFSDGASYALSLGVTNGDLFRKVIAFSPGFMAPGVARGTPSFFISHGTDDNVLPIDRTSREIVPDLEEMGYTVRYEEFSGGHTPYPASLDAGAWFVSL